MIFRRLLALALCSMIAFPPEALAAITPARRPLTAEDYLRPVLTQLMEDPVFAAFMQQPALPAHTIQKNDPAIDQDPFFMRTQTWDQISNTADANEPSFTKERDHSLSIHLPATSKSLRIKAALSPILFTDEFVFLTADDGSQMFPTASGKLENGETVGEGIFFVSYQEALKASQKNAPVKVYFMPLPGHGWTGTIEADHYADQETLSLASQEGDWVPVEIADLRQIQKVQSLNALLGAVVGLRSGSVTASSVQAGLPARGSTYGFGMLFTGFDLDNASNNVVHRAADLIKPLVASLLDMPVFKVLKIESAKADMNIGPEMVEKIIRFGWTFGAITATSIILKYTLLRDKFKERRAVQDLRTVDSIEFKPELAVKLYRSGINSRLALAGTDAQTIVDALKVTPEEAAAILRDAKKIEEIPAPKNAYERAMVRIARGSSVITSRIPQPIKKGAAVVYRDVKENGDVLASTLTTVSQVPSVVTANILERLSDRYMPSHVGGNRLLRKTLNYNFLWGRQVSTNTPVSMKTFMLGAVVMGSIDTYFVYVQQVAFIPGVAQALAPHLPTELSQRIYETYDPANEQTRSLVVNDIVRNFIAWLSAGASSYSQETQAQVEPIMRKNVDDALRRMGKNPLDPKVKEEREKLYQDAMNAKLKQFGLPDKVDFLFDVNTLDSSVLRALGYSRTESAKENDGNGTLMAESRPGLVMSSLLDAITRMKRSIQTHPTPEKLAALEILEDTRKQISILALASKNPVEAFKRRRNLLKTLSLLTYSGEVDTVVRLVPQLWQNIDPAGAQEAAIRFRQSYFAFHNGDGTIVELPPAFVSANVDEAKRESQAELAKKYGLDAAGLTALRRDRAAEFGWLVEQKLREKLAQQKQDTDLANYKFEKRSWYENRQHERAYRKAMELSLKANGDVSQDTLNKAYAQAMAAEISVYPKAFNAEEKAVLEVILAKAESDTRTELAQEPLKSYLTKQTTAERSQIEMWLFAKAYLDNYRSATIDQGLVPARSPMQLGFTQKFRQNHRDSRMATILARVVDSGMSDDAGYQVGLAAKIYRNIPFAHDTWGSVTRLGKIFLTGMTTKWVYQQQVWGVYIPWASWFLFYAVSPLIDIPARWINRAFRQQGLQPMGGFWSKTIYGVPYAWVTFGATVPWVLYSKDANMALKAIGTAITTNPAVQTLSTIGEASLPFLPALAIIPIINEIRARRANRLALANGRRALEEGTRVEEKTRAVGDLTAALKDLSNKKSAARSCEMLFIPAGR